MTTDGHPADRQARSRARALRFVRFTVRHGRWLWLGALLLAIPSVRATAGLYSRLSSELADLLPRDAPSVKAIEELRTRMPGLQYLGVVVDPAEASKLPAAERFLDDLAARIRTYPPDLVTAVKVGAEEERKFLEKNASLFASLEDLRSVRERITARRRWELSKQSGALFDDEGPPALDFTDIQEKYRSKVRGVDRLAKDRFTLVDPPTTLMLVEMSGFSTGAEAAQRLLTLVRADIAALGGLDRYAPGMRLGFAADVAVSAEEISALEVDLTVASLLVVAAVVMFILIYFRWWRSVPALFAPLLLAVSYAFALSTLPPFEVDRLNSNTAFLGSIIVGNGINFAILFLARYVEARRRGSPVEESLAEAVWGSRTGTLVAALAAGVAYGSLLITQFRGFQQFGAIGGIGMVVCWATTFLLMPPLVTLLDRGGHTAPQQRAGSGRIMGPIARLVTGHPRAIVAAGVGLTLASLAVLPRLDSGFLESDFSRLRRRDTWTEGEGYWGRKMDRLLGRYLSPTVLLADTPEAATRLAERVRQAATRPPLATLVSEVRGPDNILPPEQPEKIVEVEAIRRQLTSATRAAAKPEDLERLDRILGTAELRPITLADLPRSFTVGFREHGGHFGRSVLVFPALSRANWHNDSLATFTAELRRLAAEEGAAGGQPTARVAGALTLSADIVSSIRRDGPLASAVALAGVVILVMFMFRFRQSTLLVLGSLVVAVLWLTAAVHAFGIRINFVNFIAFPITFGIGVDYAVNLMSRFEQEGRREVVRPILSTGAAVGLCSLTTILGYSSLLLAKNQGLFLFGLVAVLGEVACLATALLFLPATLLLIGSARSGSQQRESPGGDDQQRRPDPRGHVVEHDAPPAG